MSSAALYHTRDCHISVNINIRKHIIDAATGLIFTANFFVVFCIFQIKFKTKQQPHIFGTKHQLCGIITTRKQTILGFLTPTSLLVYCSATWELETRKVPLPNGI